MSYNPNNPNGQSTSANSSPVVIASDQSTLPTNSSDIGAKADSAASTDTGTFSLIAFIKRALQNWTTLQAKIPSLVSGRIPVDGSGVTQPVSGTVSVSGTISASGTVTANIGTTNGLALDGTDGTSITPPTGGVGIRGWLSGIYNKLSNALSVTFTNTSITANAGTNLNTSLLALDSTVAKDTSLGSLTETAPATDTASSGLNGRLQRIAQRLTSLIAQIPTTLGRLSSANSMSVTLSNEDMQDLYVTGAAAQTAVVSNILTTSSGSAATDLTGYRSFSIQVVSTGTGGTYIFEGSNDNVNFVGIPNYNVSALTPQGTIAAITPTASAIVYVGSIGFRYMRLRIATTITGGSIQAFSKFSQTNFTNSTTLVSQGTAANLLATVTPTITPLMTGAIASAAAADGTANPTGYANRIFGHLFNGTTWDRPYNNQNTTTGDTGAKVASFAGATQTNFNNKGAYITVLCGTVSGTTPTMTAQLQYSFDGGTTWLNIGAASSTVTTTGNTILIQVYPTNHSVSGATPAALTTGATTTLQLNTPLPRTWRLNYTITGTTPSFTITAVYVNYIQ